MDLRFSARQRQFRSEVRGWFRSAVAELPERPALDDWPGKREYDTWWQRRLFDAGYAGIHWPVDCGGKGAGPVEHLIFLEEAERAGASYAAADFVGLMHAGPTIAAEGTPEQRTRYLPPILRGEEVWCQGFSESQAGSDLASLRTRAVRDGDTYVLTGHKIWTSHSSVADFCEILVRTDPDASKHPWTLLGSKSIRSGPSRGPRTSPRCSSTASGSRWRIGWARRTMAGESRWSP